MTTDALHPAEMPAVQLARIEGKIDLMAERAANTSARVEKLETYRERDAQAIGELRLGHQQLASDAISRDATVATTAKALRDAKETQEATDRAAVARTESKWSPITKVFAVILAMSTIIITILSVVAATASP